MRIASIDIGTNTVLLLIADVDSDGSIRTVAEAQRIIRLGRNVDASRTIRPEGFDACAAVLSEFRDLIHSHRCDVTTVCGTSALRDSTNREDFLATMKERTGMSVEVISGEDEALWTFRGGRLVLGPAAKETCTVLDIGGGSTEFIVGSPDFIQYKTSVDVGSVRLTERFITTDPILPADEARLRFFLRDHFRETLIGIPASPILIGVAGTVTTAAAMLQEMTIYDPSRINGFRIPAESLHQLNQRLAATTLTQKKSMAGLQPERADVIHGGTLILEEAMAFLGMPVILVSDHGLRYGLVLREMDKMKKGHSH